MKWTICQLSFTDVQAQGEGSLIADQFLGFSVFLSWELPMSFQVKYMVFEMLIGNPVSENLPISVA